MAWGQLCKLVGLMGHVAVNVTVVVGPEGPGHLVISLALTAHLLFRSHRQSLEPDYEP